MQNQRTLPSLFVLVAAGGGILFMLGGVITAMSTSVRAVIVAAAVCLVILAGYVFVLLRRMDAMAADNDELLAAIQKLRAADAGLRSRMTSTLRAPLASIIGFTDKMLDEPTMDHVDRQELLSEIQSDAREVERILADLAIDEGPVLVSTDPIVEGIVLLDGEVTSIARTTPPGITFETDLEPAKAWADSARVRQMVRAVIAAARQSGVTKLTLKTHQLAKSATLTIATQGPLLDAPAIAALTGNASRDDATSDTYLALKETHELAAGMGATVGYVDTFGQGHVVIEFPAVTEALELQHLQALGRSSSPPTEPGEQDPLAGAAGQAPDLSFSQVAGLRPERPSAAIRLS